MNQNILNDRYDHGLDGLAEAEGAYPPANGFDMLPQDPICPEHSGIMSLNSVQWVQLFPMIRYEGGKTFFFSKVEGSQKIRIFDSATRAYLGEIDDKNERR